MSPIFNPTTTTTTNHSNNNRTSWPLIPDSDSPPPPFQSLSIRSAQQALFTTYPSRLRLGTSTLVQPIYTNNYIHHQLQRPHSPSDIPNHHHHHHIGPSTSTSSSSSSFVHTGSHLPSELGRRARKVINYSEHDHRIPDPDIEIGNEELPQSRSSRSGRNPQGQINPINSSTQPNQTIDPMIEKQREIESLNKRKYADGKIYLGQEPPAKWIKVQRRIRKPNAIMSSLALNEVNAHHHQQQQQKKDGHQNDGKVDNADDDDESQDRLVPIRIEFETEDLRIRDVFTWNLRERHITPEAFAIEFCHDIDISPTLYAPRITEQITSQLKDLRSISSIRLVLTDDQIREIPSDHQLEGGLEPDLRVIIQLDVQIQTLHLVDRIEWDLGSNLTPELFTAQYIHDLQLPHSSYPIISHAIHSELIRHKRDCISFGLISSHQSGTRMLKLDNDPLLRERYGHQYRSGAKKLEGVVREWNECGGFGPKFEEVDGDVLEWAEIEKERLIRRARRDQVRSGRRR